MESTSPLDQARSLAEAIERIADELRPEVIRAARQTQEGRRDLDRMEYALGTIGKALVLTDTRSTMKKTWTNSRLSGLRRPRGTEIRSAALPNLRPG